MIAATCLSVVDEAVEIMQAVLVESKMKGARPGRLQAMIYRMAMTLRCLSRSLPTLPNELMRTLSSRQADADHTAREVPGPVPSAMTAERVVGTILSSVDVVSAAQRTLRQGLEQASPLEAVQACLEQTRRAIAE
eukprot:2221696-Amphidinium_carterae.1